MDRYYCNVAEEAKRLYGDIMSQQRTYFIQANAYFIVGNFPMIFAAILHSCMIWRFVFANVQFFIPTGYPRARTYIGSDRRSENYKHHRWLAHDAKSIRQWFRCVIIFSRGNQSVQLDQWFSTCGTRTTSGTRGFFRCYATNFGVSRGNESKFLLNLHKLFFT